MEVQAAYQALEAAEEAHVAACREYRHAEAAVRKSRSKVRVEAFLAAEAACDKALAEIKAAQKVIDADERAARIAAKAAAAAALPQQLQLF